VNNIVLNNSSRRGVYPPGVTYDKSKNKYCSEISIFGKRKSLGLFETPVSAHKAYCKAKAIYLYNVAFQQPDLRLTKALIRYGDMFRSL